MPALKCAGFLRLHPNPTDNMQFAPVLAPSFPTMNRRILAAAGVLLLHAVALWALQTGLVRRAVEIVVPAHIISEFISPATPPAPEPQRAPQPHPRPQARPAPQPAPQQPQPVAVAPEPAPLPLAAAAPAERPAAVQASTVAAAPAAPPAPPAPARIEPPSSDAAYLNNPKPPYPALSRRLGVDGRAEQAEIRTSSGYERLDQAALQTVRSWRFVPGTRNGVPEAMWFNVPIHFVLE